MSERELEECKEVEECSLSLSHSPPSSSPLFQVVMSLQSKESANEPLAVPNSGARSKGVKR